MLYYLLLIFLRSVGGAFAKTLLEVILYSYSIVTAHAHTVTLRTGTGKLALFSPLI